MLDIIAKEDLDSLQLRKLEEFGGKINKFGANFVVCNANGELVLLCEADNFESNRKLLTESSRQALNQNDNVCRLEGENPLLAVVLKLKSNASITALIDLGNESIKPKAYPAQREMMLTEMLALFAENFQAQAKTQEQIEMVSAELSHVYEKLVLLHRLSTNMKINEPNANYLQMACDSLTDIVSVGGIAILLEKTVDDESQLALTAGSGLLDMDEEAAAILYTRLAEEISRGKEALLDSEVDTPFRYDWPDHIKSIIAMPLCGRDETGSCFAEKTQDGNHIIGLMVAINKCDKPDFDTTDIQLFNFVTNGCAVFIENGRLFSELEELFIGSLRALTNSIDAKDEYTRGHSERVAFISRWIAERYAEREPLQQEQVHRIYLAGLLHDIGKIGIAETVLCKKGKLTEQERNCIRAHPAIGAGILSEIKQMVDDIVPAVLCHHERADGKGYPNGLTSEQIPLIGKIVGLADSFDAMTSKRTYRDAMTVEKALDEIEKGLGTQFDKKVGGIFINSDIHQLWNIIQDGSSEVYGGTDFSRYGTTAVGALIK